MSDKKKPSEKVAECSSHCYPADATIVDGRRLRWQCGCRQNGGVLVTPSKNSDPDIDDLIDAAKAVIEVYREPVGNLNRRSDFTNVVMRLIELVG